MTLDDRVTAPRTELGEPPSGGPPRMPLGRGVAPHHRRRRAAALAALAVVSLAAGISAGSGGGTPARHVAQPSTGYFGRVRVLAGTGAGSFASEQRATENAAINRTLTYTPYVRLAGAQHREIALTFDDGPGPYTPAILSELASANVPATFFEVGVLEKYFHASTSEIVARGYPIGDHTESHAPMSKLSKRDQRSQILQQISAAGQYGVPYPRLFRPPYGLWNNATLSLLHEYHMLMVLWSLDTSDYRQPGVRTIVSAALAGARPGAIILMHDAGGNRSQTVAALPQIITALHARGYKLVTVPQLLVDNPAPQNQALPTGLVGGGG